ncbi:aspartate dehydrogenase [Bosea sp. 2KB_26]|uniref:aspartate dehydrogenase n=1 Tax=Bosea sp. 2KB_26 TaxID=3237475 RepID=UPI003F8DDD86
MSRKRIGLIGFGTIAREVHARLQQPAAFHFTVLLRPDSPSCSAVPEGVEVTTTVSELIGSRPDLVVEAAGHAAVIEALPDVLAAGLPVIAASTGAFADTDFLARMTRIAALSGARLILPSGAIGGLDYLAALREADHARIRYTSRKPPAAWAAELAQAGLSERSLVAEIVLYEGSAEEAARLYPRNLNVGLTIALAARAARVTTRIVSDPTATGNIHEIEAESSLGSAYLRFTNLPSAGNPKTSAITASSLVAAIRRQFDIVAI